MKIYGQRLIIKSIIEKNKYEEMYDQNDSRLVSAQIGTVENKSKGMDLDLGIGDKVLFRREIAVDLEDGLVLIDQDGVLLKY